MKVNEKSFFNFLNNALDNEGYCFVGNIIQNSEYDLLINSFLKDNKDIIKDIYNDKTFLFKKYFDFDIIHKIERSHKKHTL